MNYYQKTLLRMIIYVSIGIIIFLVALFGIVYCIYDLVMTWGTLRSVIEHIGYLLSIGLFVLLSFLGLVKWYYR